MKRIKCQGSRIKVGAPSLFLVPCSLFLVPCSLFQGADHQFLFKPNGTGIRSVTVAGTFNNWNVSANPMKLEPDGRTWSVHLPLPYGRILYKFVVNGSDWELDPSAASTTDDSGYTNSVCAVVPSDYYRPASPTDGVIAVSALSHVPSVPGLNYDRGHLSFTFRARPNDLAAVYVRVSRPGTEIRQTKIRMEAEPASADDLYQTYRASVSWDRKTDLSYDFELRDGPVVASFDASGFHGAAALGRAGAFHVEAKSFHPFEVPDWPEHSVIYQIFPDRFANGDTRNDPPDVQPWGGQPTYRNFFGGDVAGVKQHLGYLSDLGIGAVYFNPIFTSPSNHRYETTDYLRIDSRFGTNAEFEDLTRSMHERGIRTVLDFALNHTAPDFFAFKDILEKGQNSAYKDWYWIKSYPVTVKQDPPYVAWFNYPSMPKLNVMNPAAHAYVLNAVDYWVRNAGIDGVRLDVANEVAPQLWRDLRKLLKTGLATERPDDLTISRRDVWIVGEDWGDANPWLSGDQWDSTMGYQFRDACLQFFAQGKTNPSQFLGRLTQIYDSYVPQVSRNLMNLLDSHDTPRFLTLCHGNRDLLLLAATVQLTWPGAPSIYYGDELGMTGGADPDNRRCMDWTLVPSPVRGEGRVRANPVLAAYKKLIRIRNSVPALQSGDPEVLSADDKARTFAYARELGDQGAVVAVNASDLPRTFTFSFPKSLASAARRVGLIDAISGRRIALAGPDVSFDLPPLRAAVLVPADARNLSSFSPKGTKSARRLLSGRSRPLIAKELI